MTCAATALLTYGAAARSGEPAAGDAHIEQVARQFQEGIDRICRAHELPGMTAAFALPDGRVMAFASGLADKESGAKMTIDTRMSSGSVGKTFVAATAIGLAQDGKLALDDKVQKWLGREPWFVDLPNGPELTVRHLMMHRAGLADHVNDLRFAARVRKAVGDGDADFCFTPVELVQFILKRKPLFEPGRGYAYTDTGYILLGLVIEKAGGATYYDQLRRRFLDPLKLELTEPADRRDLPRLAAGYLAADNPLGLPQKTLENGKLRFHPGNEWTGGGLVSNPQDLVRWAKELYEGRALPQPYLEQLAATDPADRDKPSRYGLGVFVTDGELGRSYGHGGWFPGYLTHLAYYPAKRLALAVQVNTDARDDLQEDIRNLTRELLAAIGTSPR